MKPPHTPRVLVCDELSPSALATLRSRGLAVEERYGLSEAALCEAVADVDAIVVRSATRITAKVIAAAPRLSVVGRAGIGVDNIDRDAATARGVVVMNTPGGNTLSTAELALALCFALARNLAAASRRTRDGSWNKKGLVGAEMTGKTLGIVGLGRVGGLLAERARGIGMHVLAADPFLTAAGKGSPIPGVELVELDALLPRVDFLSLHVPLLDGTKDLIAARELALMKRTAYVVNTSRGGVVNEADLLAALDRGALAGAALDVLSEEPPPADHPLLRHERTLVTPHLGASSVEAQDRVGDMIADQLAEFLATGTARNAVNMPAYGQEQLRRMAPALALAERMGSFAAQLVDGPVSKLEITACGALAEHGTEPFRLACLVGSLRHVVGSGVNFVNAPLLARERGVRVLESVEDDSIYHDGHLLLRVEGAGGGGASVRGALFGQAPYLTRIDGVHVDLEPKGAILVTRHEDRPGVLGRIGTALGEHGVNILGVHLGRPHDDTRALASAYLSIDRPLAREVLDELRAIEPIRWVRCVQP